MAHDAHQAKLPCSNDAPQLQILKPDLFPTCCSWDGGHACDRSILGKLPQGLLSLRQQLLRRQLLLQMLCGSMMLLLLGDDLLPLGLVLVAFAAMQQTS